MASMISEINGEPVETVIERLNFERLHPGRTVADAFKRHGGRRYLDGPDLAAFYESTDAFLYELAVWNRNSLKSSTRHFVRRHLARQDRPLDVLCIGDGLGFDSLHLAVRGHRVTYFELPGLGERFARRLFERSGPSITVLTDPKEIARGAYDAVTCLDVLEHVPDPPGMVREIASYLRPGGFFYVSAPFYMVLPWYPTHLRCNRRFSGSLRLFTQAGLELVGGRFTWYPLVLRKSGGESMRIDRAACLAARWSGYVQMLGRLAAWPFLPVHLARWLCNRRFN
ncbi:MAG TPA: class I SAM-dependent methyltransferase [Tepidisphaeraceae bacterium]|jgi:SAM-dependent methyltransferase|nr:class I SAM-dependent methyltransferase [Tepidisphaeraceae bacterium]